MAPARYDRHPKVKGVRHATPEAASRAAHAALVRAGAGELPDVWRPVLAALAPQVSETAITALADKCADEGKTRESLARMELLFAVTSEVARAVAFVLSGVPVIDVGPDPAPEVETHSCVTVRIEPLPRNATPAERSQRACAELVGIGAARWSEVLWGSGQREYIAAHEVEAVERAVREIRLYDDTASEDAHLACNSRGARILDQGRTAIETIATALLMRGKLTGDEIVDRLRRDPALRSRGLSVGTLLGDRAPMAPIDTKLVRARRSELLQRARTVPITLDSAAQLLDGEREDDAVKRLRHEATNYEAVIASFAGEPGRDEATRIVRARALDTIAAKFPALGPATKRAKYATGID